MGMRPFGWLPDFPKWVFKPNYTITDSPNDRGLYISNNSIGQDINVEWVAFHEHNCNEDELLKSKEFTSIDAGPASNLNTWVEDFDIESMWPKSTPTSINIDMDPSLPPDHLVQKYNETLLGNAPIALFPKQVLPKLRIGMDVSVYTSKLHQLMLTPIELDAKYNLSNTDNSVFFNHVHELVDEMRPLSSILKSLRVRDTQLQLVMGLEFISLKSRPDDLDEVNKTIDLHFDRLCIWQAVDNTELVSEFCSTVLIPYFKARAPRKTKQLVRISRGTLKYRNKSQRANGSGTSSSGSGAGVTKRVNTTQPPSTSSGTSGLLRALQMQKLALPEAPSLPLDVGSSETDNTRHASKTAARSISHPVYRQQSRHSQVEVRFKKSRSKERSEVPTLERNVPPFSVAQPPPVPDIRINPRLGLARPQPPPQTQQPHPESDVIEATPIKVRTTYLDSLPQPTTLFNDDDDDEIGSTDNDD